MVGVTINWPTFLSCILITLFIVGWSRLRHASHAWFHFNFFFCVFLPALVYGLFGERTKATSVKDKTVLITGSSSGLGKAFAIEAARRGASKLILVARDEGRNKATVAECNIEKTNKDLKIYSKICDLRKPEEMKTLAKKLLQEHSCIEVLINCAGAGELKHIEETMPEDADEMMSCPVRSAMIMTALFAPAMKVQKKGHIINVGSAAGHVAFRGSIGYSTARWAMRGFSKSLYWDCKENSIGVTHLSPLEPFYDETDYWSDGEGKAGSLSRDRLPRFFFKLRRLRNFVLPQDAAVDGLNGMERGYHMVHTPWQTTRVVVVLASVMPWVVEYLCNSFAGRRRLGGAATGKGVMGTNHYLDAKESHADVAGALSRPVQSYEDLQIQTSMTDDAWAVLPTSPKTEDIPKTEDKAAPTASDMVQGNISSAGDKTEDAAVRQAGTAKV